MQTPNRSVYNPQELFAQTPLRAARLESELSLKPSGWHLPKEVVGEGEEKELWKDIVFGLIPQHEDLTQACQEMGYPAACVNMTVQEIGTTLINIQSFSSIARSMKSIEYDRLIRELHHRLTKVKKVIESKEVSKEMQDNILRLNSYQNVPQYDHKNLPVSLANTRRYIEKHKVPRCDFLALYKKAAYNEDDVIVVSQFEQFVMQRPPEERIRIIATPEQINSFLIRSLDKNYKEMTYLTLLANLKPLPGETIYAYSVRFQDYWKITELSSKDAGDAFQAGLPLEYQNALVFAGLNHATFEEKLNYLKTYKKKSDEECFVPVEASKAVDFKPKENTFHKKGIR